jgi:hypothetical protein
MDLKFLPVLADALRMYFEYRECRELCGAFDVRLEWADDAPDYMGLSRRLVTQPTHANNYRLLETLVETLVGRAEEGVAHNTFERRDAHRTKLNQLSEMRVALRADELPAEINAPEGSQFTAKSKVREFLGEADTPLTVVDNYIGAGTLDCLRDVKQPIRLLTGSWDTCIEAGFERVLADFRAEGFQIEVRRHKKLHDRYILFAEKAWLVGSSLKDGGRKAFNMIEIVDGKQAVTADVEAKWLEADRYGN